MEWIEQTITSAFVGLWAKFTGFFTSFITLSFLDPWWSWLAIGLAIIAIAWLLDKFFGGISPWLRALFGVVIIDVIAALALMWFAENKAREHDKPKRKKRS